MWTSRCSVLLLPPFAGLVLRVSAPWRRMSKPIWSSRDLCAQNTSQECVVKRIEGRIGEDPIDKERAEPPFL